MTTTEDSDRIKDRIRALLNTARNDASTEGEIDNALRFASSLMARHHFSEEDLATVPEDQFAQISKAERGRRWCYVGSRIHRWESALARFCCRFVGGVQYYQDNGVHVVRDHSGIARTGADGTPMVGKRVAFYGLDEDVNLASDLYDELRLTVIGLGRLKWGGCFRSDGGAYCEGFVEGLRTKLSAAAADERQKAVTSSNGNALMVLERRRDLIFRKEVAGSEWLRGVLGVKLRNGSGRSGSHGSVEARRDGRADGARSNVSASRRGKLT